MGPLEAVASFTTAIEEEARIDRRTWIGRRMLSRIELADLAVGDFTHSHSGQGRTILDYRWSNGVTPRLKERSYEKAISPERP